jgi:hypothetical protein
MTFQINILRVARRISIDLDEAIAAYETFKPTGSDRRLIARVNGAGFHPAFNAISEALHRETILALCRIWDPTKNTSNINWLVREICKSHLLSSYSQSQQDAIKKGHPRWQLTIEKTNNSARFKALKRARDRAFAHSASPNQPYLGKARVAKYGDERRLIEITSALIEEINAAIGYWYVKPFKEQRLIRRKFSRGFWASMASQSGKRSIEE